MARPTRGFVKRRTLQTTPIEEAVISNIRAYHGVSGVTLSENETVLFALQCYAVTLALTEERAKADLVMHLQACTECDPTEPPRIRCPAGIYLRDHWARFHVEKQVPDPSPTPPPPPSRRTAGGRRPLTPPPPGATS